MQMASLPENIQNKWNIQTAIRLVSAIVLIWFGAICCLCDIYFSSVHR